MVLGLRAPPALICVVGGGSVLGILSSSGLCQGPPAAAAAPDIMLSPKGHPCALSPSPSTPPSHSSETQTTDTWV